MAVVRVCSLVVLFLCIHGIIAKPMFNGIFCDYLCDDDDDSSDSSSDEDFLDFLFDCSACSRKRQPKPTVAPMTTIIPSGQAQNNFNPMSINIQPGSGFNLTMNPGSGVYSWIITSNGTAPAAVSVASPPAPAAGPTSPAAATPDAATAAPASTAAPA